MHLFGIPLKPEIFIKGLQGSGFLCATSNCWFFSGEIWLSFFSDCFMKEAYDRGLDVIFNYGLGRRPQGLS